MDWHAPAHLSAFFSAPWKPLKYGRCVLRCGRHCGQAAVVVCLSERWILCQGFQRNSTTGLVWTRCFGEGTKSNVQAHRCIATRLSPFVPAQVSALLVADDGDMIPVRQVRMASACKSSVPDERGVLWSPRHWPPNEEQIGAPLIIICNRGFSRELLGKLKYQFLCHRHDD